MYSQRPCEQNPLKNLGEKGAWAYPGTAEIFSVPHIIPGTGKATKFQFCTHILSYRLEQKPITNFGKSSRGLLRTLEIFQGTHISGTSRGRLCDSSAFLYCIPIEAFHHCRTSMESIHVHPWIIPENECIKTGLVQYSMYSTRSVNSSYLHIISNKI